MVHWADWLPDVQVTDLHCLCCSRLLSFLIREADYIRVAWSSNEKPVVTDADEVHVCKTSGNVISQDPSGTLTNMGVKLKGL